MTRGHNIIRRLASQSRSQPTPPICQTCLLTLNQRRLASSAASSASSIAPIEPSPTDRTLPPNTLSSSHRTSYKTKAAVLLSRPPVITRDLTPFEKAFFLYQRRLNERLALPFTRYFYYQKDTPEDVEWKRKIKERQTPARDIGVYNAYSEEGWNDELLVGAKESEPEEQIEALIRDAQVELTEGDEASTAKKHEVERPYPRVTEADKNGDVRSLNRLLQRTLYLLVKSEKNGRWGFPSSFLMGKESLHTAAERTLIQSCGPNMNTWLVGNIPINHQIISYPQGIFDDQRGVEQRGEKVFFMKGRILAGQANLHGNEMGLVDYRWLSKEEIQQTIHARDWGAARGVLADL